MDIVIFVLLIVCSLSLISMILSMCMSMLMCISISIERRDDMPFGGGPSWEIDPEKPLFVKCDLWW
jgi:hypothetical protein